MYQPSGCGGQRGQTVAGAMSLTWQRTAAASSAPRAGLGSDWQHARAGTRTAREQQQEGAGAAAGRGAAQRLLLPGTAAEHVQGDTFPCVFQWQLCGATPPSSLRACCHPLPWGLLTSSPGIRSLFCHFPTCSVTRIQWFVLPEASVRHLASLQLCTGLSMALVLPIFT